MVVFVWYTQVKYRDNMIQFRGIQIIYKKNADVSVHTFKTLCGS